jgi:misacylated tRNA(Ala) deacylase
MLASGSQKVEDMYVTKLVLAHTPFFPKGGGQPSDKGFLYLNGESNEVIQVTNEDGIIYHHVHLCHLLAKIVGSKVVVSIDVEWRTLTSKLHTGGELVAGAMRENGYTEHCLSGAIHYPGNSCLRYKVKPEDDIQALMNMVNRVISSAIDSEFPVIVENVFNSGRVKDLCGYVPSYLDLADGVRVVTVLPPVGRPCMGAHIENISELKGMSVTGIKVRKGELLVKYALG